MKVYLAEYYPRDRETHTTTLGIFESSELAWEAIYTVIAEKDSGEKEWYHFHIVDFGVVEYELNKRVWL